MKMRQNIGKGFFCLSYTLDIEAVSCDELYADVTSVLQDAQCTPEEFAGFLRKEIVEKTQCTASVGLGEYKDIKFFNDTCWPYCVLAHSKAQ